MDNIYIIVKNIKVHTLEIFLKTMKLISFRTNKNTKYIKLFAKVYHYETYCIVLKN